ncbi:MAG: acyl-CoA/acyl-ACP dehydrogenase [Actinomycetota bacterium]|nr:acyl-CoA/acyl-ACP dehydrogenase [Actinomycetota bacterium]
MTTEPVSAWTPTDAHPVITVTRAVAARLAEGAAGTEIHGVSRETLDALAEAGLYGVMGPVETGGLGLPAFATRRVAELLAGADPQVWFLWYQHGPVVAMLAASTNLDLAARWLPDLCSGRKRAGVAFSHLRSAQPSITAVVGADETLRLSGRQPWCTGWGLVDVILLGAVCGEEVVFALVPARDGAGLRSTAPLPLAVMGGTSTVALHLDDYVVPENLVVARLPYAEWFAADQARNANVQPSTFGVAFAALDRLTATSPELAEQLGASVAQVRHSAYGLVDNVPTPEQIDERLALRGNALVLGVEATTALVAARGGGGLSLADPAQRLLRAAAFQLVHAQSGPVRSATLDTLARRSPATL